MRRKCKGGLEIQPNVKVLRSCYMGSYLEKLYIPRGEVFKKHPLRGDEVKFDLAEVVRRS